MTGSENAMIVYVRYLHNEEVGSAFGSNASVLYELAEAGPRGCVPAKDDSRSWAAIIQTWRALGLEVVPIPETLDEDFRDRNVRYVLRTPVEVLEVKEAA
jgi:hypothetical protein